MRVAAAALFAAYAVTAFAHPAPNSIVRFEFEAGGARAEYWIPESELDYARAADPAGDLPAYLLRHVAAETTAGERWRVAIASVRGTNYLGHPYIVATLTLTPPAGALARDFVLVDDAVTHEVRNHRVFVVARHGAGSDLVGALQYPANRLAVAAR